MIRLLVSICGIVCFLTSSFGQSLYVPRDVKTAYENKTRSEDGRPGSKYWQNKARYDISVTAMPPGRTVKGSEKILCVNNSPDSLDNLIIKLFLNIHKPGAPRINGASDDYLTSGVHIDALAIDGKQSQWKDSPRYFTWQPLKLPEPLPPGDSVQLEFEWHYEISLESGREGMIDSTTYYLAYFYPRVAVYDDYNGWDTMDFTDQQEFYSDFNDYIVHVTVPSNYLVWGTGTLLNADEVLQKEYANRFRESLKSDDIIHVATLAELQTGKVTKHNQTNTWVFKARDIPDMAFGLSDHFSWDAGSVVVDESTGRRASAQAAYNDTAEDFHYMVGFVKHALSWFSRNWPGVPYPYEKSTVFRGFAGMEYPMMVNDETYADTVFSRFVAEHEIAHTYFPFYMGINETRFAFMDEGWATTHEFLIGTADLGKDRAESFFKRFRVAGWIRDKSIVEDLPIITPADELKNQAYGNNAYGKPALGYLALKELLGDDMFRKCLHEYMNRWHGKHPIPWDFFNTFNDVSGENLNWFWNTWYFSNYYIDITLEQVSQTSNGYSVRLHNLGGMPAPVNIIAHYSDGTSETIHQSPAIWKSNQQSATIEIKSRKKVQAVEVDGGIWMDANTEDNHWTAR